MPGLVGPEDVEVGKVLLAVLMGLGPGLEFVMDPDGREGISFGIFGLQVDEVGGFDGHGGLLWRIMR
jgi:hypothetical protein